MYDVASNVRQALHQATYLPETAVECGEMDDGVKAWIANAWKATPAVPFSNSNTDQGDVAAIQKKRADDASDLVAQTDDQCEKVGPGRNRFNPC